MRLLARPLPRASSAALSAFCPAAASHPANKTQVYLSKTTDPLLNLSVEHYLLQSTPPDAAVLVLYTNSPCVVIGRNQNPWLEANLPLLARIAGRPARVAWSDAPVRLVRRRSGGGAVFHDAGNVNFSILCPTPAFDRDRHAEMVVRALAALGRPDARVNKRHDIVAGAASSKVSGSAYKLTRLRSLHHGTCLLRSPNLASISALLRSPATAFIKARGVDSVRSPVTNLGLDNADFQAAVVEQFADMYGRFDIHAEFDSRALAVDEIRSGYQELQSRSWTYGQTPRFTFCTHPFDDDSRPRPQLPFALRIFFEARHGLVERFSIDGDQRVDTSSLVKTSLHEIHDWTARLAQAGLGAKDANDVGTWMNQVLGTDFTKASAAAAE